VNRTFRIRAEAVEDILDAFSWYESHRTGLGREFEQALDAAFDLLRQAPEAGPDVYRDFRRVLVRRFPYSVYYTLTPSAIEVRAVAHIHRDPEHWQKRR
jgi:plasmid stabilization system protein ParE